MSKTVKEIGKTVATRGRPFQRGFDARRNLEGPPKRNAEAEGWTEQAIGQYRKGKYRRAATAAFIALSLLLPGPHP